MKSETPAPPAIEPEVELPEPARTQAPAPDAPPPAEEEGPPIFDEAAESAFRAEARARGETVVARAVAAEPEEADPKALPPLDQLVAQIPPDVRELLDDLFRVKFVRVTRVPRNALKR